jgi:hypothetical protein
VRGIGNHRAPSPQSSPVEGEEARVVLKSEDTYEYETII